MEQGGRQSRVVILGPTGGCAHARVLSRAVQDGQAVSTARARPRPSAPASERMPPCRGSSSTTGAATTSRRLHSRLDRLRAARLEGGWHAGREGGELVAAVAPAAHAAPVLKWCALVITPRAGWQGWWRASCHERGL